jgi:alpha-L-fucosidase
MNTPYGKDILAELAQACAKKDFKLGLYYSLPDWHHPAYPISAGIMSFLILLPGER